VRRARFYAVVTLAGVLMVPVGLATAQAASGTPVRPGEAKYLLRASDLGDHYGHVTRSHTDAIAHGGFPTACENPMTGKAASPTKAAQRTLVKEIGFPAGIVWQNAVFVYPTSAAAQSAYLELRREATAYCNMNKVINIGTDGDVVAARVTLKTTGLPPAGGVARFAVAYGTSVDPAATVNPMYADSYDYSVYSVNGRVISRVGVVQVAPVETVEKTDAESAAVRVAKRVVAVTK
jgi:hypothetical protein